MTVLPLFRRVRRYRALAAFSLGLAAFAPPAGAAQISAGTWIETVGKSCPNTQFCFVDFSAVPAGKTLIARNVACRLVIPNTASNALLYLGAGGKLSYLVPGTPIRVGTGLQYYLNTEIFVPFVAGVNPKVAYTATAVIASIYLSCTLSGELKTP